LNEECRGQSPVSCHEVVEKHHTIFKPSKSDLDRIGCILGRLIGRLCIVCVLAQDSFET
jgi:hypothetical protein